MVKEPKHRLGLRACYRSPSSVTASPVVEWTRKLLHSQGTRAVQVFQTTMPRDTLIFHQPLIAANLVDGWNRGSGTGRQVASRPCWHGLQTRGCLQNCLHTFLIGSAHGRPCSDYQHRTTTNAIIIRHKRPFSAGSTQGGDVSSTVFAIIKTRVNILAQNLLKGVIYRFAARCNQSRGN